MAGWPAWQAAKAAGSKANINGRSGRKKRSAGNIWHPFIEEIGPPNTADPSLPLRRFYQEPNPRDRRVLTIGRWIGALEEAGREANVPLNQGIMKAFRPPRGDPIAGRARGRSARVRRFQSSKFRARKHRPSRAPA